MVRIMARYGCKKNLWLCAVGLQLKVLFLTTWMRIIHELKAEVRNMPVETPQTVRRDLARKIVPLVPRLHDIIVLYHRTKHTRSTC
jgi:hypothetical protein